MDNELYKKIYYDGVHLNKYGHEIYSEIISKFIRKGTRDVEI